MEEEIWKQVVGYESYKVSNTGHVKRLYSDGSEDQIDHPAKFDSRRIVNLYITNSTDEEPTTRYVDEIVAEAFIEKPCRKAIILHINGDVTDDRAENLKWLSSKSGSKGDGRKNYRPVRRRYLDGRVASEYATITEAARESGVSYNSISRCCSGAQKTAGGYLWEYADRPVNKNTASCPFCGGKCEITKVDNPLQALLGTELDSKYVGKCNDCGITTREFDTAEEVLLFWNKRY